MYAMRFRVNSSVVSLVKGLGLVVKEVRKRLGVFGDGVEFVSKKPNPIESNGGTGEGQQCLAGTLSRYPFHRNHYE
jgi:hypothetical protein